jgi:ubiquitin carboxyl-terminal hydrolase 34
MEQVPKNWIRFEQYFQFWNDLMIGGDAQKEWMIRTKMITYLLDFMLEKQSPLHLYEKKHQMGKKLNNPLK